MYRHTGFCYSFRTTHTVSKGHLSAVAMLRGLKTQYSLSAVYVASADHTDADLLLLHRCAL
jgi:hypothetical protein